MPPLSPDSTNCSSGASVESVELPCRHDRATFDDEFTGLEVQSQAKS